uniref:Amidase domain-containing protein n=1 Tax=Oryza nivara TaxID=4536 RepID=A0A0E0IHW5_ORYNI
MKMVAGSKRPPRARRPASWPADGRDDGLRRRSGGVAGRRHPPLLAADPLLTSGNNPHHSSTRNPHNPGRVSGGSSSVSAAAVCAGLCPVALGVDGGGSVRMPAALCGVVGFKPTAGRLSNAGVLPLKLDAIVDQSRSQPSWRHGVRKLTGKDGKRDGVKPPQVKACVEYERSARLEITKRDSENVRCIDVVYPHNLRFTVGKVAGDDLVSFLLRRVVRRHGRAPPRIPMGVELHGDRLLIAAACWRVLAGAGDHRQVGREEECQPALSAVHEEGEGGGEARYLAGGVAPEMARLLVQYSSGLWVDFAGALLGQDDRGVAEVCITFKM